MELTIELAIGIGTGAALGCIVVYYIVSKLRERD